MSRTTTAHAAARLVGSALQGDDLEIRAACAFPNPIGHALSFLGSADRTIAAVSYPACVIAKPEACERLVGAGYSVIASMHPKYDLARVYAGLLATLPTESGIHPSAVIGRGVEVDATARIGPGCVLEGRIRIGPRCELGSRVVLVNDVTVVADVRIRNGTVIGEDAFSFGTGPGGATIRFPSLAGVHIGPRVEIGNNVVIARGIFEDTVIAEDCRVNDLAHIGNAVRIGARSMLMAKTDVSARVVIGNDCWIGQSAAVRQGVRIGDGAQIGMCAAVTKDVPAGIIAFGVPARPIRSR